MLQVLDYRITGAAGHVDEKRLCELTAIPARDPFQWRVVHFLDGAPEGSLNRVHYRIRDRNHASAPTTWRHITCLVSE